MALYGAPVTHPPLPQRATNPLLNTRTIGGMAPGSNMYAAGLGQPERYANGIGARPSPLGVLPANSPAMHDRGQPGADNISHPPDVNFHHYGVPGAEADPMAQIQELVARMRGFGGRGSNPLAPIRQSGGLGGHHPLADLLMALGS